MNGASFSKRALKLILKKIGMNTSVGKLETDVAATSTEHNEEKGPYPSDSNAAVSAVSYSSFTPVQKVYISCTASFSAMFSGLSSFIYYPAITALSSSLGVSIELINLTITSYQLVSGVAPSILGDMADQTGRRPVSLVAFSLYCVANIGLAVQNSYAALIALRCLQSAGASGGISVLCS